MQIKICRIEDGPAHIEVIDSTDGAIARIITLDAGEEVVINAPTAASPADIEVGEVTPISASDPAGAAPGTEESSAGAGPVDGEGAAAPTDPAAGGDTAASSGTEGTAGAPTTSAASDKPLYRVLASEVPEGFVEAGLTTPDGFTLYSYEGDTAGQPHTFDVGDASDIGLYAEADDTEQPVVAAATDAEGASTGDTTPPDQAA